MSKNPSNLPTFLPTSTTNLGKYPIEIQTTILTRKEDPNMQSIDDIKEQVLADCKAMDKASEQNSIIRDRVIAKLDKVVEDMEFNPALDKPSAIEAKSGIVSTLLKALTDSDAQYRNIVKTKQTIKAGDDDEANAEMLGQMITEVFKKIKLDDQAPSVDISSDELDDTLQDLVGDVDVTEGEISPVSIATDSYKE